MAKKLKRFTHMQTKRLIFTYGGHNGALDVHRISSLAKQPTIYIDKYRERERERVES